MIPLLPLQEIAVGNGRFTMESAPRRTPVGIAMRDPGL